jgi:hypothetical protein
MAETARGFIALGLRSWSAPQDLPMIPFRLPPKKSLFTMASRSIRFESNELDFHQRIFYMHETL